ncbi:ExeM/NucH family extracellular endonuclease [Oleiharenicola lentus]|uniref:ExeM/NucH family extracellular endonuclease n=1 Tax=Oleiharenicola lentus TaxID=2508720 RepID=UPI003F666020
MRHSTRSSFSLFVFFVVLTAASLRADNTYHALSTGNFSQNWSNSGLITANDNWSGVPSIIGYLGQELTGATGTNPQTLLGTSAVANDPDVIANQTAPDTLTNGGVAEFDALPNPTVALQGSGTADAPYLLLHINTLGRSGIIVSYTLRDVDGSADNSIQQFALQYRVGEAGNFTNLPAGYVADASTGPSLATTTTNVSVALPAAVENQEKVQIRIMTTNAVGNDEWIGVDDIVVSSGGVSAPGTQVLQSSGTTAVSEAGATTDTYTIGLNTEPAGAVTITATASGQVELSVDGVTFGPTAQLVFSAAAAQTITVRAIDDSAVEGAHSVTITQAITATADATNYPLSLPVSSVDVTVTDNDNFVGFAPIHTLQGSGASSPFVNYEVSISGVVTGFYVGSAGTRDGFYVQEEDDQIDADPQTSEGVYVYASATIASGLAPTVASLAIGDVVTVVGKVVEFNGLTELTLEGVATAAITKTGTASLPAPVTVTLPAATSTALERYENMRVQFTQTLTVTGNFSLGQFGEVYLSSNRVNRQPTNFVDPNDVVASGTNSTTTVGNTNVAAVTAQQNANALATVVLDDATSKSYPDPTPYLNAAGTRRLGDTVTGLSGVLTYRFNVFRLDPTGPVTFADTNPRPATPPSPGGAVKVASANVLNYFVTLSGSGGRGADTAPEFSRQKAKVIANLATINADIVGLMEIENDRTSSPLNEPLIDLVAGLNATLGTNTYSYIDSTAIAGTDLIQVALIYKSSVVTPLGAPLTDTVNLSVHNRPPLAQTFQVNATGAKFTVVVNHLKSKASAGSLPGDSDQNDGQSASNASRKAQATALASFVSNPAATFGDPDVLIIGDLNANAEEDPIDILRAAGFIDQLQVFEPNGYSYQFGNQVGYLDHALANASLASQISGAAHWHINAAEPAYYDYNTENKSVTQQAINVGTPFASADHDPVIIGLNLATAPAITQHPAAQAVAAGGTATFSVTATGTPLAYQWRKGATNLSTENASATTATLTLTNVQSADVANNYNVVITNAAGTATSNDAALSILTGFAGWQASNFTTGELSDSNVSGPNAVYGQDGLSNLVKYGLGLTPKQNITTGLPETTSDATNWIYTYTRPTDRTDVTFTVERSTDLSTWTTAGVSHTMISSAGGVETWRATFPLASAATNFFRLQVVRP